MLIMENDEILCEVKNVETQKIGEHEVIRIHYKCSYFWYILIALAVSINSFNLLCFYYKLGIHVYLLIGLLILYFKHLIVDFLLEDYFYYDVISKDKDHIYVEYSRINDYDYINDEIKPRFDFFTVSKVLLHYLMYVFFAYYLHKNNCNEIFISIILTSAMFISSYLSIDFDYSDIHYYLNFSICCVVPVVLLLSGDKISLVMIIVLFSILFVCLYQYKKNVLLKIFIILFCLFSHYHYYTNYPIYYHIENGAYY